jgi:hypothetical protein
MHASGSSKLLEARESVRICVNPSCQRWMVKDCTQWLSELERRIPTAVLLAKDSRGNDMIDVTVSVGTEVTASTLDGHAIEMNPGARIFVFEAADGRRVERRSLILEGVKEQVVAVTFDDPTLGKNGPAPVEPSRDRPIPGRLDAARSSEGEGSAAANVPGLPATSIEDVNHSGIPWRTIGFAVGGTGAAGIALGSVFGILAIVSNRASNANGHCTAGCDSEGVLLRHRAIDEANVSTVAFAIGGVLLAPGVSLLVLVPPARKAPGSLGLMPSFSQYGANVIFSGKF